MGSDERHFNVSVGSDGQNHKTVSTNHNQVEVAVLYKPTVYVDVKQHSTSAKHLAYSATCSLNSRAEQCSQKTESEAWIICRSEEQLSSKMIQPSNHWEPSSTSLLLISPGLCAMLGRRWWWSDALCSQTSVDILGTSCDQCRSMVQ